jgi:hypothetical protein
MDETYQKSNNSRASVDKQASALKSASKRSENE